MQFSFATKQRYDVIGVCFSLQNNEVLLQKRQQKLPAILLTAYTYCDVPLSYTQVDFSNRWSSPLSPWRTQKQGSRRCCADVTIRVNLRLRRRLDPPFQPAFLSHKIADNTRWKGGEPDGTPSELKKRAPSKHLALLFFFNAYLEKLWHLLDKSRCKVFF